MFLIHKFAVWTNRFKKFPNVRRSAWISEKATIPKSCVIGDRVKIKDRVVLGENCFINDTVYIGGKITLGKGCLVGVGTKISSCSKNGSEKLLKPNLPLFPENGSVACECDVPIFIGDYVAIGALCTIDKGVTIGNKAIIMSNSAVFDDMPANAIVQGNPAKIVGYRLEAEI